MGEDEKKRRSPFLRGETQPAGDGEVDGAGIGVGDDDGESARAQRFLDGPQEGIRLSQGDGEKTLARQAESDEPVTMELSPFGGAAAKPRPQERTVAFPRHKETAEGERRGKAHGGRSVAVARGGDLMDGMGSKAAGWKVAVDAAFAQPPQGGGGGGGSRQQRRMALDPGDAGPQSREKGGALNVPSIPGGNRRPPHSSSWRRRGHDPYIFSVLVLF